MSLETKDIFQENNNKDNNNILNNKDKDNNNIPNNNKDKDNNNIFNNNSIINIDSIISDLSVEKIKNKKFNVKEYIEIIKILMSFIGEFAIYFSRDIYNLLFYGSSLALFYIIIIILIIIHILSILIILSNNSEIKKINYFMSALYTAIMAYYLFKTLINNGGWGWPFYIIILLNNINKINIFNKPKII